MILSRDDAYMHAYTHVFRRCPLKLARFSFRSFTAGSYFILLVFIMPEYLLFSFGNCFNYLLLPCRQQRRYFCLFRYGRLPLLASPKREHTLPRQLYTSCRALLDFHAPTFIFAPK